MFPVSSCSRLQSQLTLRSRARNIRATILKVDSRAAELVSTNTDSSLSFQFPTNQSPPHHSVGPVISQLALPFRKISESLPPESEDLHPRRSLHLLQIHQTDGRSL